MAQKTWAEIEKEILSPYAALSAETRGRQRPEPESPYRTAYQRDRDRVLHSKSFRRLKHKTQVFLAPEGDHYRTRLTHTLEVAQIARTIARALRLNEDLTEAVALAHDLGHTPFGHAGERCLDKCVEGGFRHYEQSVRVVERLENTGRGLNLTYEVRDGMLRHTKGEEAVTLEGRIVRWADKIAYVNHDMDDAIRAGVLQEADIPLEVHLHLGDSTSSRIDTLVTAMIDGSQNGVIAMDPAVEPYFWDLHTYMYDYLYLNSEAKVEEKKVDGMISALFDHFLKNPDKLPEEYALVREQDGTARAVCDYVAGMTDNFALEMYHELYIPRGWAVVLK
ncbi:MAG: deoxyguanosinetriphosphate triphosphohydrolase [Ruminococcaceae bacterium]|nr:deoxyguanosinetriphosphate triphosphohydrolase [Oscillospiraceae bacterium]